MIIRVPLIPGINDSRDNLTKTVCFVAELDPRLHVDLLPYHRLGGGKFRMIGKEYPLADVVSPSDEQMDAALEIFKGFGLDCAIER